MALLDLELLKPVQFGREAEPVTRIKIDSVTGRQMREFKITATAEGGFLLEPYEAARVGLKMAGIAGDKAFLDMMDGRDVYALGQAVFTFLVAGRPEATGKTQSPE